MPGGPGKYDELATYVRTASEAQGAIVVVVGGKLGSGFSCQIVPGSGLGPFELAHMLRVIVDELEGVNDEP